MSTQTTYLYIVYENYKYFRNFNKFHEIGLTTNQIEIKEKYIDKDEYIFEFFVVPFEYGEKVLQYVQKKFIKTTFPCDVLKGELQNSCIEFIKKCNKVLSEKNLNSPFFLSPPLLTNFEKQKLIVLLSNKVNNEITVICNNETLSPTNLLVQLSQLNMFQILQSASLPSNEVDSIINSFQENFKYLKTSSIDLQLPWYNVSENDVLTWLKGKSTLMTITDTPPPLLFDIDDILSDEIMIDSNISKKRKK